MITITDCEKINNNITSYHNATRYQMTHAVHQQLSYNISY